MKNQVLGENGIGHNPGHGHVQGGVMQTKCQLGLGEEVMTTTTLRSHHNRTQ